MLHEWTRLMRQAAKNACGVARDGRPGDWDSSLYQLIHESYAQPTDANDEAVMAVLICLHEAVQGKGKITLHSLAELCIAANRGHVHEGHGLLP